MRVACVSNLLTHDRQLRDCTAARLKRILTPCSPMVRPNIGRANEVLGEMFRGVTVRKTRGPMHEKGLRELTIDGKGMHVGEPFRSVPGILSSFLRQVAV